MSLSEFVLWLLVFFLFGYVVTLARVVMIQNFKIAYYETKLKYRNVDISSVENIGLIEILRM